MNFVGLDIETAPTEGNPQPYALQPWRAREGMARITSVAVSAPAYQSIACTRQGIDTQLSQMQGMYVATWNGVFDIAWFIASGYDVSGIRWVDAMLLWKWAENSQHKEHRPNWSLVDGAKRWLKDWPKLQTFIDLKEQKHEAGDDDEYWELRAKLDAFVTQKIAERIWEELTPQQQQSALIEAECLVLVARSWVNGIKLNTELAAEMAPAITQEMEEIEVKLGVQNQQDSWTPSKILRSPKQLGELLYDNWGLACGSFTDKGARATDKAALTYLADKDTRCLDILRWRELNTQYTKFIAGVEKCETYLDSSIVHPSPKLFSTYTGRMTYASKSGKKGEAAKAKIGVPLHQWPRNKQLRRMIRA